MEGDKVLKRCELNRYCWHTGPLYTDRLGQHGWGRPRLVGRCYVCGGYVCNRCAHRREIQVPGMARTLGFMELLCPVDGEPLGRGSTWAVFAQRGGVRQAADIAEARAACDAIAGSFVEDATDWPGAAAATAALIGLAEGRPGQALRCCGEGLDTSPDDALLWLLGRHALEREHRLDAAWAAMQWLMAADADDLARALGRLMIVGDDSSALVRRLSDDLVSLLQAGGRAPAGRARDETSDSRSVFGEFLVSRQPMAPGGPDGLAAAAPGSPSPVAILQRLVEAGAPGRSLVAGVDEHLLAALLDGLGTGGWAYQVWATFVERCAGVAGLPFAQGWRTFAKSAWNQPILATMPSALTAQLVVDLRDQEPGDAGDDPWSVVERYERFHVAAGADAAACLAACDGSTSPGELLAAMCFAQGAHACQLADVVHALRQRTGGSASALFDRWPAALVQIVEACPLFQCHGDVLGFSHPFFEDACLARHLARLLFDLEPPDFRSFGQQPITQGTAALLACAVRKRPEAEGRVADWVRMKRQRRSLFRGSDIPTFVRNLALVLIALRQSASGLDLADTNFDRLLLAGVDFSGANLAGATFVGACLSGARFEGAILDGTRFDDAER